MQKSGCLGKVFPLVLYCIGYRSKVHRCGEKGCKTIQYSLNEARENNDLGRIEDCKSKLEQCHDYLSDNLTPRGKIRCTESLTRKSIAVTYRSVVYYIEQLAKYLSEHEVRGNP